MEGTVYRSDSIPFALPNSLFNLSRLSVWWLRLGITIERFQIQIAGPQCAATEHLARRSEQILFHPIG